MTTLLKTLLGPAYSTTGKAPSFNDFSMHAAEDTESELQAMHDPAPAQAPAEAEHPTRTNVWQSTFSPQMNSNMKKLNRDYYDTVDDPKKSPSVWDNIVKAETIKHMSFQMFDMDKDGMIDAADLRAHLGEQANVEDLIKQADKNKDGKLDFSEFCELLKES